ncbi:MAG: two pore domain potassium channel family protein [Acidobacteria bacterium]|jgi:Ion channel|nr:MAG: two pore domain potassium channel family protein [Acidobacteriota bacterium]
MLTSPAAFLTGVAILIIVVWDAFEVIILPRRVTRRFRLSRLFYKNLWSVWKFTVGLSRVKKVRESAFGIFGPISLLILVAVWAVGLVLSFALMQYGSGSAVNVTGTNRGFWTDAYLSGTTFFTLGLGDVVPRSGMARALVVTEAGLGFGFLAGVIGYLPFIYGSFSKREVNISLLDSRAGTPPTAGELLRRHSYPQGQNALRELLKEWELWCAELMESHLSYPVLAFFRSQHDNQSWIASLTAILDACALIMVGIEGACERQAQLTFAIARHAVVDLSQVFNTSPKELPADRLPHAELQHIRDVLAQHGLKLHDDAAADQRLADLRRMYEPYIYALANYLSQSLPPWIPPKKGKDNWQTTAWGQAAGFVERQTAVTVDDHF